MKLNCCKSEDTGSDEHIQSKVSDATNNANNNNEANTIPVAMDGVDNNPTNEKSTNHQQEMENGEDDDDSIGNERENESKSEEKTVN